MRALVQREQQDRPVALTAPDLPWLGGAIATGGLAGPVQRDLGIFARIPADALHDPCLRIEALRLHADFFTSST